jgi:hypothetical protein
MLRCTEEEYLCINGAGPDWGDAGNHSPRGHCSNRHNRAVTQHMLERDAALLARRETLRAEYRRRLAVGTLTAPTPTEQRIRIARGHPDNAATLAARRLLEARGIKWQKEPTDEQPTTHHEPRRD